MAAGVLDDARGEHPDDERLWALAAAAELALEHDVAALRVCAGPVWRWRPAVGAGGQRCGPWRPPCWPGTTAGPATWPSVSPLLRRPFSPGPPPVTASTKRTRTGRSTVWRRTVWWWTWMLGSTVRRRAGCLPAQSRRLLELLAAAPSAGPSLAPSVAQSVSGSEVRPDPGLDLGLLGRAAGLSPAAVAEHLDPAVALGLVAVGPGVARLQPAGAGPALLAGLSPSQLRATHRLVAQARLADRPRRHRHQG